MKHQQVVVDYWSMVKTSCTCLLLALSGYILIKMVQTIFWLPGYLQKNQKRLEELAALYSLDLNEENSVEAKDAHGECIKGLVDENHTEKEIEEYVHETIETKKDN